ncbi:hypothetical protein SDC9_149493 [bioreactor metagenome]|uniref:Uncharacterized protein n=1 Tax=bioreactor metagenome TaxID=1076179 RepID=A0A645EMC7_9ZZZZ
MHKGSLINGPPIAHGVGLGIDHMDVELALGLGPVLKEHILRHNGVAVGGGAG